VAAVAPVGVAGAAEHMAVEAGAALGAPRW